MAPTGNPVSNSSFSLRRILFRLYYIMMWIKIAFKQIIIEMCVAVNKFDLEALPSRSGDVAVVTGGAAGIGFEVVKKLLQKDFHVIMGVRSLQRGNAAIDKIRKGGITTGKAECVLMDLTSLDSVRRSIEDVLLKTQKINLLFNNAGIMMTPYNVTIDNVESQFQVNYLSHFLLTNLLLPTLIKTGSTSDKCSRIVNTSGEVQCVGNINCQDLQHPAIYSPSKAYFDSKLAQVVFTKYLDRKMMAESANVRIYSLHPGAIPTDLWGEQTRFFEIVKPIIKSLFLTPAQGADTIMYAALAPNLENKGGQYLLNNREYPVNPQANDLKVQENLWHLSIQLAGLSDEISIKRDTDKSK